MRHSVKADNSPYFLESINALLERNSEILGVLVNDFRSPNSDIESFIKRNAVQSAMMKNSVTYLVLAEKDGCIDFVGYFTLSIKVLRIKSDDLSNTEKKRLRIFSYFDESNGCFNCPAILLAQFGRNFSEKSLSISGDDLMALALDKVYEAQGIIGGRILFLECEQREKLIDFYKSQGFRLLDGFSKSVSDVELRQMFRLI